MKQFFKNYYKKFVLIIILIPVFVLFNQMEFPKIDAFIRDALQYLNSAEGVTKEIVTVNIDTSSGEFSKPFNYQTIFKVVKALEEYKAKHIIFFLDASELSSDAEEKTKIYNYLASKKNIFLNLESNNKTLYQDEVFKNFPRFLEFDLAKDGTFGAKDNKHRRAMLYYNKKGQSEAFNSLATLQLNPKEVSSYTSPYYLWETTQVYIKSFFLGTFGNYQIKNSTLVNTNYEQIQNKTVLIGSFDEWAHLSSPSIFDLFGKNVSASFANNYFPIQDSVANLINFYLTGNYIKYVNFTYEIYFLFIILCVLILINTSLKNKIYVFISLLPTIVLMVLFLYLIGSAYIDFSRSLMLLLLLQYFAIPIAMLMIFKEQEVRRLHEINKVRIDSLLFIAEKVAHDIRSPLSAINLILSKVSIDNSDHKDIVINSLKRIDDAAEKILTKYRTNLGINYKNYDTLDVSLIIDKIISEKKILSKNVTYTLNKNLNSSAIGHQIELERVLSNIYDNSIHALQGRENSQIITTISTYKNLVKIDIHDNGIGIPEKVLRVLGIERVSTKDLTTSGNGIALIHAKRAIERMNGKIDVTSEENTGTNVIIYLQMK